MNPLIKKLPTKIKVGNEILAIDADYRNCLQIILAYEDEELTMQEKHYILLNRLYECIPEDIEKGIEQGIKFLNCGEDTKNIQEHQRIYSFQKDAKYIFTAVGQSSKTDLEDIAFFHWWKFCYYFLDISSECTFSQIISLRQKKAKGKLSKEERKAFLESRDILDLDYISEESEEVSEFMKKFNGGEETRDQEIK